MRKFLLIALLLGSSIMSASEEVGSSELKFFTKQQKQVEAILLNSTAEIDVFGLSAKVTIKQEYENVSNEWVEGIYLLPLPDNASIDGLLIKTADGVTKGVIKEKNEAKKIYKEAKEEGKKAALIETERADLFTTKVANIAPKSKISIEISYIQPITYLHDEFSLHLPNTLTPRYTPKSFTKKEGELNSVQKISTSGWANKNSLNPPFQKKRQNSHDINITVTIDSGYQIAEVDSSSHKILWSKEKDQYKITLKDGKIPMNKDFRLSWKSKTEALPNAALFSQRDEDGDYLSLMVIPPQQELQNRVLPREVVFVIDSSGSMQGEAMRQAKASLINALTHLSNQDKFNIIEFDSKLATLYNKSQNVTSKSIKDAKRFINNMVADGGTKIKPALELSFKNSEEDGFLKQIIFLTDGSISNERELLKSIRDNLGNSRLFMIAIGSAPNLYFMRKSAEYGRGSMTYVNNMKNIEKQISQLFSQLKNPMLRDITIKFSNGEDVEYFPNPIPDLYLGEPLMIYAKTKSNTDAEITITGKLLDKEWKRTLQYGNLPQSTGISKIWANKKIAHLMNQSTLGISEETIKKQVTPLALKHSIASKYTSFVAVEEKISRPSEKDLKPQQVPNLIPQGNTMFDMPYPKTATNSKLFTYAGLLFLLLSVIFYYRGRDEEKVS
jgi:Ca-activated chloride channel family protein